MRYALPQPYEELDHAADVGVAVEGASAEEALARLVLALSALLTGGEPVSPGREERITVTATGGPLAAALAVLRELLFRFATERVVPGACEVQRLEDGRAEVVVALAPFDAELHAEGLDVKAVTWHAARFAQDDGRWRARVLFDI